MPLEFLFDLARLLSDLLIDIGLVQNVLRLILDLIVDIGLFQNVLCLVL